MKKLLCYLLAVGLSCTTLTAQGPSKITVFTAKKIITMETAIPEATAVAVADGRILAVGDLESLKPWTDGRKVTYDSTFENKIVLPGFIDPHVHPSLPAVLTQFDFLAPEEWKLPTGDFPGALNQEAYVARLKELGTAYFENPDRDPDVPYVVWGFHQLWHGDTYRTKLDELFPNDPVILWHRSFHEVVLNTAALEHLGITEAETAGNHEIDYAKGLFSELGAKMVLANPKMAFLFDAERYGQGMQNFVEMLHQGGVTTAMDMGVGIFGNADQEIGLIHNTMDREGVASRIVLTPIITYFLGAGYTMDQAHAKIQEWTEASTDHVSFDKHFKLMLDGAIFSGLSQFEYPGYIDGHEGEWLAPTETTYDWGEYFWNKGYQLHLHTNGDKSTNVLIDHIGRMLDQKPRLDHRATLEHFAYSTESQIRSMGELNVLISANPYYQYILSDIYAERWLGEDRARNMVALGMAKKYGLTIGLHSDCPMAPLSPLTLVETAVNRQTINGNSNNAMQKISVYDALRAITIDAAFIMRKENQIGSIVAGKMADFVILESDPFEVAPSNISEIEIWGTVYEGNLHPIEK